MSISCKIDKPTVNSYGKVGNDLKFGPVTRKGTNFIGFHQDDPGNTFHANVTTKPSHGGWFGLFQTAEAVWSRNGFLTGSLQVNTPGQVLDNTPNIPVGDPAGIALRGLVFEFEASETNDVGYIDDDGYQYLRDNPFIVAADAARYPNGDWWKGMREDLQFKTHLIYIADLGSSIPVSLGRIDWRIQGGAVYLGNGSEPLANYMSASNWLVTPFSITKSTPTLDTEIVEWSDYMTKYIKIWSTLK